MSMPAVLDFNYEGRHVRTVVVDDEPWWVAKDVCEVLEITNHRDAVGRLDDDEKDAVGLTDAIGRTQETTVVNEPGLYTLILGSRKPEAKAFKRWITHEVLPTIRKTGTYSTQPGGYILTTEQLLNLVSEIAGKTAVAVARELTPNQPPGNKTQPRSSGKVVPMHRYKPGVTRLPPDSPRLKAFLEQFRDLGPTITRKEIMAKTGWDKVRVSRYCNALERDGLLVVLSGDKHGKRQSLVYANPWHRN